MVIGIKPTLKPLTLTCKGLIGTKEVPKKVSQIKKKQWKQRIKQYFTIANLICIKFLFPEPPESKTCSFTMCDVGRDRHETGELVIKRTKLQFVVTDTNRAGFSLWGI